jgi:hypothetical protein
MNQIETGIILWLVSNGHQSIRTRLGVAKQDKRLTGYHEQDMTPFGSSIRIDMDYLQERKHHSPMRI